jgi:hypothetical protein
MKSRRHMRIKATDARSMEERETAKHDVADILC